MDIKCSNCGNLFNDVLNVCPACGTEVVKSVETPETAAPDAPADFTAQAGFEVPVQEAPVQEAAPQPEPAPQPEQPSAPSYQYATYNYDGGQSQPQPQYQGYQQQGYQQQNYQQPGYQQPGYQQPGYQQPGYQQPGYQQQSYQQPGYQQQAYQNYAGDPNTKSKLVAGLLGIFLGTFGVHNFYLGYNGKAVAQLLMTILSCGALAAVSAVWGLIEGILILAGSTITTDATGRPLGE
ncbi:MAG: TM2 domain-containing protein [Clostridia bacterium]|nr:TM2 domain-containing protein [Clostridia bacterium]